MAINKEVFKVRALSSLFFVIAMMIGLLWDRWSFLILFSIIHFGCWWEFTNLVGKIHQVRFHGLIRAGLAVAGFAIMLSFCGKDYQINGYGIRENFCLPLSVAGFILMVTGIFKQSSPLTAKSFFVAALGWLYISMSWGMMISLRQEHMVYKGQTFFFDGGRVIPLLLVLSVWANDTCAYLVGSMIGKTPFSKISPKKTWEGTAGGAIVCISAMGTLGSWLVMGRMSWMAVWIALAAAVIGTIGDLFESKLKRMANVKDSGNMLPGHGGFMDRFDSLLFATPVVWVLIKWVL